MRSNSVTVCRMPARTTSPHPENQGPGYEPETAQGGPDLVLEGEADDRDRSEPRITAHIPEGTSVAIPMAEAGFGRGRQFWAAVATSAPQPVGALLAFLAVEEIGGLLPLSFAFAAGAMLELIVLEMLPTAFAGRPRAGPLAGIAAGAALILALSFLRGV
jgi:hypothetical protein